MKILALDISSTHIGLCYDGRPEPTIVLRGDIAVRCRSAAWLVGVYIVNQSDIDYIAIESPVAQFAKALIPQCRVAGAVLADIADKHIAWCEISPAAAKRALTGKGNAKKDAMIAAANRATNMTLDEHQADAYGLWWAALQIRAERVAA